MANAIASNEPGHNGARLAELEKRCSDLAGDNRILRDQLTAAERDRDDFLIAIYSRLKHDEFEFTKEEALGYLGKEPPLEQVIAELERDAGK